MDRYKKLQAVRGLIYSLDEQMLRIDNHKDDSVKTKEVFKRLIDDYYNSIVEFLNKKDEEVEHNKTISFTINGKTKHAPYNKILSYEDIIDLAYPDTKIEIFSVTYTLNNTSSSLVPGDTIQIQEGMKFNVFDTSKA